MYSLRSISLFCLGKGQILHCHKRSDNDNNGFRISNKLTSPDMHLDVDQSSADARLSDGDFPEQHWTIASPLCFSTSVRDASGLGIWSLDAMDPMHAGKPGKVKGLGVSMPGFEVVPESKLDFEYYKNRGEFAEDHGGGEIYGTPEDSHTM